MSDKATPHPLPLDTSHVAKFQRDGYVLTPDVLESSDLERFGAAVDREVASRTADDTRAVQDKSTYEQSFVQCMRLWETSSIVRELTCHPKLAQMAALLLGVERVLLWQDQALYKEADGRITDPHQDQPFWPIGNAPLVSAWIPFDDVDVVNGAMAYVPGSHEAGRLKVVDITHSTTPYDILADPALRGRRPVSVPVSRGSVVWHHGFTVHQAAANTSGRARRVFTVVYLADGYPRVREWPCFPLDRAGVGVGDPMRGEGMPQLWPAPERMPEAARPTWRARRTAAAAVNAMMCSATGRSPGRRVHSYVGEHLGGSR